MVETILRVDGMMCGMCESHINDVVRKTAPGEQGDFFPHQGRDGHRLGAAGGCGGAEGCHCRNGLHRDRCADRPYEKKGFFSFLKK